MRKQLWKWTILLALPLALFAIIRERRSWQPRTFQVEPSQVAQWFLQMAFSADGKRLILRPLGPLKFLDIATGKIWPDVPQRTTDFANEYSAVLSPNEKTVASMANAGRLELWDVAHNKLKRTLSHPIPHELSTVCVAFSPDGQTLAESRGESGNYSRHISGSILLWDTQTGKLKRTLSSGGNTIIEILFALDGRTMIGSGLYAAQMWDVSSGKLRFKVANDGLPGSVVALSNDGKLLVSRLRGAIKLWNAQTGHLLRQFEGNEKSVKDVTFAPNGKTLAVLSNGNRIPANVSVYPGVPINGEVRLWDIQSGTTKHILFNQNKAINSIAFSPDGQIIAGDCDGEVDLWDTKSGKLSRRLLSSSVNLAALAFSPDGSTLATASESGIIKLWRIK